MYVGNDPVNFVDPSGLRWQDTVCGNRFVRRLADFFGFFGEGYPSTPANIGFKLGARYGGEAVIRGVYMFGGASFFSKTAGVARFAKGSLVLMAGATAYNVFCKFVD